MKQNKFEIKNLLTKKKQLDKRFYRVQMFRKYLAMFIGGLLAGSFIGCFISDNPYKQELVSPKLTEQKIVTEVEAYEPDEDYYRQEPLRYLRWKGQQLGINEYEITKIISVMKCESGLRPDAINKNRNGTFDLGIGQINDVHSKRISRQDRMDFVKNIDFIYVLYQEQGLNPWVCTRLLGINY